MFSSLFSKPFEISQKKLFYSAIGSVVVVCLIGSLLPRVQTFDASLSDFFAGMRTPFWDMFFYTFTYLGNPEIIEVFSVLLVLYFFLRKDMAHFFIFLGTIIGNVLSVYILKDFAVRLRPHDIAPVYWESGFSFPSGHAAISVVFYGLLSYLLAQKVKTNTARYNILFGWIFFLVMIGFSRVYLGVHFLTDVLAGYAVGFFWLSIGIIAFEQLFGAKKNRALFWSRAA